MMKLEKERIIDNDKETDRETKGMIAVERK